MQRSTSLFVGSPMTGYPTRPLRGHPPRKGEGQPL